MRQFDSQLASVLPTKPAFVCFNDLALDLLPRISTRRADVTIGRVADADGFETGRSDLLDILRRVLEIKVCAHSCLLLHKAEVPVRNAVMFEPFDCLTERLPVKVLNEQPVSNDPNPDVPPGETAKSWSCAWQRSKGFEQATLRNRESMQRFIPSGRFQIPLREPVGDLLGQVVQRYAEPFRCNDADPAVEIGHYSVEIDSEDESLVGIHHYSSAGASETCDLICWGHAIIGSVSRTPCKAPWSLLSRSGPRTAVPRYAATTSS